MVKRFLNRINGFLIVVLFVLTQVNVFGQNTPVQDQSNLSKANIFPKTVVQVYNQSRKPVSGLEKSDFELKINGLQTEIKSCVLKSQKLSVSLNNEPRLFVLIFNVCTYSDYLAKTFPAFFNFNIKSGDRVMLIVNGLVQNEIVVENPQVEIDKIVQQVTKEAVACRDRISALDFKLRYIADSLMRDFQRKDQKDIEKKIDYLFADYQDIYNEYMQILCKPVEAIYNGLSQYLEHRDIEKWVFQFNQVPVFHELKPNGDIVKRIDKYFGKKGIPNPYTGKISPGDASIKSRTEEICNRFINSGAIFISVDIKEVPDLKWKEYCESLTPVPTIYISEMLSRVTGGNVLKGLEMNSAFQYIYKKAYSFYILGYDWKSNSGDSVEVSVKQGDNKYFTVYNPQGKVLKEAILREGLQVGSDSGGVDQEAIPIILQKVADYCRRLEEVALSFYCTEEVVETQRWDSSIPVNVNLMRNNLITSSNEITNKSVYGYRLIKDPRKNIIKEERLFIERDGVENLIENVSLTTRFKYGYIMFSPGVFQEGFQSLYSYRIVNKRVWHGENAWIVEAVPRIQTKSLKFVQGRFWVSEKDFSIMRVEFLQQSIFNFDIIEANAKGHNAKPAISFLIEYDYYKNGLRFPSKLYSEEAYRKGTTLKIESSMIVTLTDYIYYNVESKFDIDENESEKK